MDRRGEGRRFLFPFPLFPGGRKGPRFVPQKDWESVPYLNQLTTPNKLPWRADLRLNTRHPAPRIQAGCEPSHLTIRPKAVRPDPPATGWARFHIAILAHMPTDFCLLLCRPIFAMDPSTGRGVLCSISSRCLSWLYVVADRGRGRTDGGNCEVWVREGWLHRSPTAPSDCLPCSRRPSCDGV